MRITDYGTGIPVNLKAVLFDIGKQTSREGTSGEIGTGYGMPLVKKFMEAYGGSIEVFSQEQTETSTNHGTEVKLILKCPG